MHIIPSVDNRKQNSDNMLDYGDKFGEEYADLFGPVEGLKKNLKNYHYSSLISLEGGGLKIRYSFICLFDCLKFFFLM